MRLLQHTHGVPDDGAPPVLAACGGASASHAAAAEMARERHTCTINHKQHLRTSILPPRAATPFSPNLKKQQQKLQTCGRQPRRVTLLQHAAASCVTSDMAITPCATSQGTWTRARSQTDCGAGMSQGQIVTIGGDARDGMSAGNRGLLGVGERHLYKRWAFKRFDCKLAHTRTHPLSMTFKRMNVTHALSHVHLPF